MFFITNFIMTQKNKVEMVNIANKNISVVMNEIIETGKTSTVVTEMNPTSPPKFSKSAEDTLPPSA